MPYATSDKENDPLRARLGDLKLCRPRLFWKIDNYDRTLNGHSPDAADPSVTCRVLTVMLASEY